MTAQYDQPSTAILAGPLTGKQQQTRWVHRVEFNTSLVEPKLKPGIAAHATVNGSEYDSYVGGKGFYEKLALKSYNIDIKNYGLCILPILC